MSPYMERDFMDVMKLRNLRRGGDPGLYGWAQCDHKCPYKRESGRDFTQK